MLSKVFEQQIKKIIFESILLAKIASLMTKIIKKQERVLNYQSSLTVR